MSLLYADKDQGAQNAPRTNHTPCVSFLLELFFKYFFIYYFILYKFCIYFSLGRYLFLFIIFYLLHIFLIVLFYVFFSVLSFVLSFLFMYPIIITPNRPFSPAFKEDHLPFQTSWLPGFENLPGLELYIYQLNTVQRSLRVTRSWRSVWRLPWHFLIENVSQNIFSVKTHDLDAFLGFGSLPKRIFEPAVRSCPVLPCLALPCLPRPGWRKDREGTET